METASFLVLVALLAGFTGGAVVISELINNLRRHKRKRRVLSENVSGSLIAYLMRNGVVFLNPLSRIILRNSLIKNKVCFYSDLLCSFGYLSCDYALVSVATIMLLICLVGGFAVSGSFLVGFSLFACLILAFGMMCKKKEEERKEKIREAIPEALQTMKTCFFVGYSLPQVFEQLTINTEGPLKNLFEQVLNILNTGGTFDEALDCIKKESTEQELIFLAAALEIQHKTGGSIEQVLEAARESVRDEIELKRTLRTQTAQAKLSAQVVTLMPFVLIVLFSFISDGFLAPFFESVAGILLLSVALFMQFLGIFLVKKMLKVEVV